MHAEVVRFEPFDETLNVVVFAFYIDAPFDSIAMLSDPAREVVPIMLIDLPHNFFDEHRALLRIMGRQSKHKLSHFDLVRGFCIRHRDCFLRYRRWKRRHWWWLRLGIPRR